MKSANTFLSATLLAFAVIGCQQATENSVDNNSVAAAGDVETLPPDEAVPGANDTSDPVANDTNAIANEDDADDGDEQAMATIPAQYRGRWGLVAEDCTSTRGDAKGLMTIGERTVRFYESTATLKEQRPAIATSFAGLFSFTGEGQTWQKVMNFTRTGVMLKRAQDDGTFNYRRCG